MNLEMYSWNLYWRGTKLNNNVILKF